MNHYPHYFKPVSHLNHIDIYRVLNLYGVTDPAIAHAVKKLLCAGDRGSKDARKDIVEARDALNRKLDMMEEDEEAEAACVAEHGIAVEPAPSIHEPPANYREYPAPLATPGPLGWRAGK